MSPVLNTDAERLVTAIRGQIDNTDAPPWGKEAAYDDDFQAIKARIDSLSTLSGSIDQERALSDKDGESIFENDDTSGTFTFIVETGTNILTEKSKDLRIACYVALGLYQTNGLHGLATGLSVVHALIDAYWENLYPSKHRMRARGAAIGFLMQRLSDAVELDQPEPSMDDRDALEHSLERLSELQAFFMEEMGEHAPITSRLKRLVEQTLRKTSEPEPNSESGTTALEHQTETSEGKAGEANTQASVDAEKTGSANAPKSNSVQSSRTSGGDEDALAPKARTSQVSVPDASAPPARTGDGSPPSANATRASAILQIPDAASENEVIRAIVRAAGLLRDADPADSRPYRLVRSARWDPMHEAPPNEVGRTRIQPPSSQRCDYLRGLLDTGDTATLIEKAEDSFLRQPFHFWLDLQRLLVRAMAAEGETYAATRVSITNDVVQLVQRVPDLVELTFADGTPFADASTRAWISDEVEATTSAAETSADAIAEAIEAAKSTLTSSGLSAALSELQHAPVGNGRRNVFRIRLAKGKLCLKFGESYLALALLEALSDDLDASGAEDFDQTLAVDTWCALYRACQSELDASDRPHTDQPDEGNEQRSIETGRIRQRAQDTYRRICAVAPARALKLNAPTAAGKPDFRGS